MDQEQARRIGEELARGIDWQVFLALVDRHRIANLVYSNVSKAGGSLVPEAVLTALQGRARSDTARALRHTVELVTLARNLEALGIQVLALKGPLLSLRLYQDPASRHLKDLDILIHPGDLGRAEAWLLEHGYQRLDPPAGVGPRLLAAYRVGSHHFAYRQPVLGILLELHWRFHAWSPGQVERLWVHASERSILGGTLRQLDDDALLILLCEHGAQHWWFRIKWLSDVAMLLARKAPHSWTATLELAGTFDARLALAQAVLLCHWLYAVPVPESIHAFLLELPEAEWLGGQAVRAMNAPGDSAYANVLMRVVMGYRYPHTLDPGYSLFRHFRQIAFRLKDTQILPLPDWCCFLYYPLRPFLWLWRHRSRST